MRGLPRLAVLPLVAAACVGEDAAAGASVTARPDTATVAVNGTRLFVRLVADVREVDTSRAEATPLLVVHGGPLLDHAYLSPALDQLVDERKVIYFDQRLSGRSDGVVAPESLRLDTLVSDLEGVRELVGAEQVDVLAHSWGGLQAVMYTLAHPDRVRSLILVSPMAPSAQLWQEEQMRANERIREEQTANLAERSAATGVREGDVSALEAVLRYSYGLQMHDLADTARLVLELPRDYLARSRQLQALGPELQTFDLTGLLGRVQVPVLLMYGASEPGAAIGGAAYMEGFPVAEMVEIEGSGHFPFLEREVEFLEVVRSFLSGQTP